MTEIQVPRLVIGGTTSGVGKTTIAVGLMAALVRRGLKSAIAARCWGRVSTCIWRPTPDWLVASWPHAPGIRKRVLPEIVWVLGRTWVVPKGVPSFVRRGWGGRDPAGLPESRLSREAQPLDASTPPCLPYKGEETGWRPHKSLKSPKK